MRRSKECGVNAAHAVAMPQPYARACGEAALVRDNRVVERFIVPKEARTEARHLLLGGH